jgi:hypothetical protein
MSAEGHSRRSNRRPVISGLPRLADILGVRRHVSKVPCADNHRLPSDPEIAIIKIISGVVWESQVNWRPTAKGTQGEKSRRDRNLPWRFSIPVSSAAM